VAKKNEAIEQLNEEIKAKLKGWPKIVKRYQQADNKKAIIQMATTFVPFFAIWVLMYFSLDWSYLITLGLGFLNGFMMVRIFIIQHDCGHQSYFKSTKVNNIVGKICSVFSFIPFSYWAQNHNFHHVHSGKLETRDIGDIDTLTVKEFKNRSKWGRLKYRMFRHPVTMFLLGPIYYLGVVNHFPFNPPKGLKLGFKDLIGTNLMMFGVYVAVGFLVGWTNFLMVQVPITIFFGIIAIWFFYVQHQHEHSYKQWKENWEYLLSAMRGSTYYKLPRFMHWLTGNIGYHHIHHLNSGIPSYNLVKCAKENPIFQKFVTKVTFVESLNYINHKLWDEASERMISFREFYRMEKNGQLAF